MVRHRLLDRKYDLLDVDRSGVRGRGTWAYSLDNVVNDNVAADCCDLAVKRNVVISNFNSTLSWLDSSESERRAVMELVSALTEPGTLDELGIGSIRDTIADALFPGTSTIQTRARYFLFVPWILQVVEAAPGANSSRLSRELELRLCDALDKAHGANAGVIGRQARASLRRWPSSIYWVGLQRWGIRREPAAAPVHGANQRQPSALMRATWAPSDPVEDRGYESADGIPGRWAAVPPPPEDFPDRATFELTLDEGRFLRDCVDLKHPQTYLAHILREGDVRKIWDADYPWEHSSAALTTPTLAAWLDDAKLFSLVHRGAAVLYSVMLAEALEHHEDVSIFSTALTEWFEEIHEHQDDLAQWDRPAMWRRLQEANPRLRPATMTFADRWHALAMEMTRHQLVPEAHPGARAVVREREVALKGRRARLTYAEARDIRRGYPASGRLDFRWGQVQRIVADILEPLESP